MSLQETITLYDHLKALYPESSKRTLLHWIKGGRVLVEGKTLCNPFSPLAEGQKIFLRPKETVLTNDVKILYQDFSFIVIQKPEGLLSVPKENSLEPSAWTILKKHFRKKFSIYPVHRIDRDVSGVLLFAIGKESQEAFKELFAKHALTREYLAIVEGLISQESGTWESFLLEKRNFDVYSTTDGRGEKAITHFQVFKRSKNFSYLKLFLETGKKHQIRVHCKDAGHPIVGDIRYGSTLKKSRLCLHAAKLSFTHPLTKKFYQFESPLPQEFLQLGMPVSCPTIKN